MKNNNYMTSVGYSALRTKLSDLRGEYKILMTEMQEVKNNCLSSEDTSELNHYRMMLDGLTDMIETVEKLMETSTVIDTDNLSTEVAIFGTVVTIENLDTEEVFTYRLVSGFESDPKEGKISIDSPLGQAIKGSRVGDVIDFDSPRGFAEYEIIEISK